MTDKQLFRKYLAPTSFEPFELPVTKAKGTYLWDDQNKQYIDLAAGISVCNVGHCHPNVVKAIQKQSETYLHIMVYGELVQSPQVEYAQLLCTHLPEQLNNVYFTNSGSEAVEGAMKLAKRLTGRSEIIACRYSYHGATQGALSLIGDEYWRQKFRPLLPNIKHVSYNDFDSIEQLSSKTACIILEPIQAAAGIIVPDKLWLQALLKRCNETGTLLILDEIQTAFGRTGKLWAFQHFDIIPDILLLAKALGGGMPLGAFISSKENMKALAEKPILGHITTFGGHPLSCAAGKAAFEVLFEKNFLKKVSEKEKIFRALLKHPAIKEVRGVGLMLTIAFKDFETAKKVVTKCRKNQPIGVFTNWFLFASNCVRISPPLTISEADIKTACQIILKACDEL